MSAYGEAEDVREPHHGGAKERLVLEVLGSQKEDKVDEGYDEGRDKTGNGFATPRSDSQRYTDEGKGKAGETKSMSLLKFGENAISLGLG